MNSLLINIDSNVYKTDAVVQKTNTDVQNKNSNVHVRLSINERLMLKARKCKKSANDLRTAFLEIFELFVTYLAGTIYIVSSPQDCFILPAKDPSVWDVCINAFGKRVWA